jgi:hypothetical protein
MLGAEGILDVPLVSMSLMGLATSTGHTHPLPPSASPKAGIGFPTGAYPKRGESDGTPSSTASWRGAATDFDSEAETFGFGLPSRFSAVGKG